MSRLKLTFASLALMILPIGASAQLGAQNHSQLPLNNFGQFENNNLNGSEISTNNLPTYNKGYNNGYNHGYNNGYNPGYNSGYGGDGAKTTVGQSSNTGSGGQ
jgi:hypothetical protein